MHLGKYITTNGKYGEESVKYFCFSTQIEVHIFLYAELPRPSKLCICVPTFWSNYNVHTVQFMNLYFILKKEMHG